MSTQRNLFHAVDTSNPVATLQTVLEDCLKRHSTRVFYTLASPVNRRSTGSHDDRAFDRFDKLFKITVARRLRALHSPVHGLQPDNDVLAHFARHNFLCGSEFAL